MLKKIDEILDSITMYRLVLYYLIILLVVAFMYSILHLLPFTPVDLIFSIGVLLGICYIANHAFAKIFKVQTNIESLYITALILVLIITPKTSVINFELLVVVGVIAMASKYILNISGKHIFNPASIAMVLVGLLMHQYASWWIATKYTFPFLLLGFLIVRKIRREKFIFVFLLVSTGLLIFQSLTRRNINLLGTLKLTYLDSPILFFSFVMLTEPLTTPPTKILQYIYSTIVSVFFVPFEVGSFFTTPEIALSIGNIFSYLVSPKVRVILKLKEKIELTNDVYDFVFERKSKFNFTPGQYMEWTLGHKSPDARGNRRYFTISSSPTEDDIRIGVKFQENGSSFKQKMMMMKTSEKIVASQITGDFTLPKEKGEKLVFIAGGIGITPFRSIIKYLVDTNEKRDIVLIYSEKNRNGFVYKDVFDEAVGKLGIKTHYVATEVDGRIDDQKIKAWVPDFKNRMFYLSGPHGMVTYFEEVLESAGLPKARIKVDYFPGFA